MIYISLTVDLKLIMILVCEVVV